MTRAQQAAFRLACTLPKRTVEAIPYERRAPAPTLAPMERARELRSQGKTVNEIAAAMNIPRTTAARWAKGL